MIDDILTNDGKIFLEISGKEMVKKKGKEFIVYDIFGLALYNPGVDRVH